MTTRQLIETLDLGDTHELVLARPAAGEPLLAAWRIAADDARAAYLAWCDRPSALTHAAYLAAEDQADAATATLCAARPQARCVRHAGLLRRGPAAGAGRGGARGRRRASAGRASTPPA